MALNFLDPETTSISVELSKSIAGGNKTSLIKGLTEIHTSSEVTGIELRMLPPLIKENNTPKVWPFPGYAKLYCLTIVVSDVTNMLAGTIDLKGFPRIGNNEHLPINKTIFYWQADDKNTQSPNQIHVFSSIIKSKESLRDVGQVMTTVKNDDGYKSLISGLATLAKGASTLSPVTDIIVEVAGIVGKYLGKVEDKALATVINSYTTIHGDFDKLGVNDLNYTTRNVDMEFDLTVRDESKNKTLGSKMPAGKEEHQFPDHHEHVAVDMAPL
jgi:hypothetical protein